MRIGRALRQQGDGALRHRGRQRYEDRQAAASGLAGLRAAVGGNRLPGSHRATLRRAQVTACAGAAGVSHRATPTVPSAAPTASADRWREDYRIAGVDGLDLHHLYRAMAWLGEELPAKRSGRPHAVCAPLHQGSDRRTAVGTSARSVHRGSTWCSWTPPACTSRRRWPDARPATATARTTGPICGR